MNVQRQRQHHKFNVLLQLLSYLVDQVVRLKLLFILDNFINPVLARKRVLNFCISEDPSKPDLLQQPARNDGLIRQEEKTESYERDTTAMFILFLNGVDGVV